MVTPIFLSIRDVGIGCDGVISFCCEAQFPYSSLSKNNYYVNLCVACLSLYPERELSLSQVTDLILVELKFKLGAFNPIPLLFQELHIALINNLQPENEYRIYTSTLPACMSKAGDKIRCWKGEKQREIVKGLWNESYGNVTLSELRNKANKHALMDRV